MWEGSYSRDITVQVQHQQTEPGCAGPNLCAFPVFSNWFLLCVGDGPLDARSWPDTSPILIILVCSICNPQITMRVAGPHHQGEVRVPSCHLLWPQSWAGITRASIPRTAALEPSFPDDYQGPRDHGGSKCGQKQVEGYSFFLFPSAFLSNM